MRIISLQEEVRPELDAFMRQAMDEIRDLKSRVEKLALTKEIGELKPIGSFEAAAATPPAENPQTAQAISALSARMDRLVEELAALRKKIQEPPPVKKVEKSIEPPTPPPAEPKKREEFQPSERKVAFTKKLWDYLHEVDSKNPSRKQD